MSKTNPFLSAMGISCALLLSACCAAVVAIDRLSRVAFPTRIQEPHDHARRKSITAVSASTASGMLWRCERARSSAVCVACR